MMASIMSINSISSGGNAQQEVVSRHQKDDSKEEKNDNNCKETKSITNSSSGIGEGDNNMMDKPNCTRQVSSDNVGISARRSLQNADGMQKKEENTSCDQQQQLSEAHQGYNMASSPTQQQRSNGDTIITPTSVRSITLAQLYHQSRRSRHSDHTHRRSSNDSMSSSILPPPPLVSGSSSQEQEKIWMETATAISATNNEEWSFAPTFKSSTISQESQTFGSSNSLASIEMDEYDTTCLDDDMTVDTVFEGTDDMQLTKKKESPPAA